LCVFSLGYSLDRNGEVGGFVRVIAGPIAPYHNLWELASQSEAWQGLVLVWDSNGPQSGSGLLPADLVASSSALVPRLLEVIRPAGALALARYSTPLIGGLNAGDRVEFDFGCAWAFPGGLERAQLLSFGARLIEFKGIQARPMLSYMSADLRSLMGPPGPDCDPAFDAALEDLREQVTSYL
jgi:hypothetical protein